MARLALLFATGAALTPHLGRLAPAFLLLLALPPVRAWLRPSTVPPGALVAALVAGGIASVVTGDGGSCVRAGPVGAPAHLVGSFVALAPDRPSPFEASGRGCRRTLPVLAPAHVRPGVVVRVGGRWREGPGGAWVAADSVSPVEGARPSPHRALVRWRGDLTRRLEAMYGTRAPLVAALTLARKEGLDPELREAFARSGIAHLLAISGFHVGVVALLLLTLLRASRLRPRRAAVGAALGTWAYVALLGFPDAACRAAVIVTAVAASRLRGRPPARWGPLGTALLLLLALDPGRIASPGFQLSFAGAAGLAAWARGIQAFLTRRVPRIPTWISSGVAAGVSATLATLPLVAWHFERVSLVGIPATLVASPLVALSLPGALASLLADRIHPAAGRFLAGGVDVGLAALEGVTRLFAAPSWSSVWVPRTWIPVAVGGAMLALLVARGPRVRARARRGAAALGAAAAVAAWPALLALQAHGTLEVVAVDVGQGDAIALRTPGGRWMLVDAGPPPPGDPGGAPVVRELRRRGVRRLELLVLTHPDLDHVGGAEAVLSSFEVGAILEPSRPTGKDAYVSLLEAAAVRGVPWKRAEAGQRFAVDGVTLEVLSPPGPDAPRAEDATESNAISVVLAVRYGELDALLTGDAPMSVERAVTPEVGSTLEILKVGHHGSATSTDTLLLARTHPRVALVSVGRGNRFGHPAPQVLARLERFGVEIHRTDREGTLRVLGRRDGSFTVVGAHAPR